jgi:hypothetical protein
MLGTACPSSVFIKTNKCGAAAHPPMHSAHIILFNFLSSFDLFQKELLKIDYNAG